MPAPKWSPQEQEVLDYHRRNLDTGLFFRQPNGQLTTFKGAVVGTPKGETIIPLYWHGKEQDVGTAARLAEQSGIPFPAYSSVAEALRRERMLHDIMTRETAAYQKTNR